MSGCLSSSMTGSTDTGPLQPQEDPAPLPIQSSTFDRPVSEDNSLARQGRRRHQPRRKMTSASSSGQTIQLTPLWEHVATFVEISERLRDPEWEVRQHALRVLMDVLPTLNVDVVDKVMQPVVPELINNLGHPAPAVRKGALDTLRVYLIHSPNRDSMVKNILHDGLNRPDAHNPFQTNVTTGVILSAPLLLFPSSNSPPPATQVLKDATIAFASRLVQVPHQEAVLKSLMKIRDAVGEKEFESYLVDYDNMKKNIEVLSKIYNIKPCKKREGGNQDIMKADKDKTHWDSDSDTSGIAEEEDEVPNGTMPSARVLLETEIKFNEETAITMTILEEKNDDSDGQDIVEAGGDIENAADALEEDKRKTPRRVHFGGEIVKLRTPDSDETESIEIAPKTRIPLPVSPATKMPERIRRRPSSQPCSSHVEKQKSKRASRSASSSPKRDVYTHNAQLSPKKSILTKTIAPVIIIDSIVEETKNTKNSAKEKKSGEMITEDESFRAILSSQEVNEIAADTSIQTTLSSTNNGEKLTRTNEKKCAKDENDIPESIQVVNTENSNHISSKEEQTISERDNHADVINSNKNDETTAKQMKDCTPTELSSSERKTRRENKNISEVKDDSLGLKRVRLGEQKESDLFHELVTDGGENGFPFGSPINDCNTRINRLVDGGFIDDEHVLEFITEDQTMSRASDVGSYAIDSDDERRGQSSQCDRKSASEANGNVTCSSSEGEGKPQEPNWEELGLVDQDVLDDLHNKDDWRARVRALERVASALRTSSALIAIESRLGSLLHAVLGGERSCRVAAAGLAVAKVVVAGVSEDALRKKLPQLAWGLARQGGPAAAQLTKIAMLRLKPSLLLEQLLQPHCLSARNAKTRENALQLLIFSLVTFPSTEFKLDIVAGRVVTTVADRRRRVRQAALDTLAVLAQIYDSEKVLEAGKRAVEDSADAEAMLAAIRARLARKSLPLVSADGLVVYGLQISPTVQIATGPDVDWIVAGSGSVSPGTGRTRGQIIATSKSAQGRASRNANANSRESPWIERPNLVALGVGLQPKTEQSVVAWQILPSQSNDDNESEIKGLNGRNVNAGTSPKNLNLRFEEQLRSSYTSSNQSYDSIETDVKNNKEFSDNFEQKARNHKNINEIARDKESTTVRGESRIPILSTRERHRIAPQNRGTSINIEYINSNSRQTKDALDSNRNRINSRQENDGSYAIYQRRKRFQQEDGPYATSENQILNQTFDSHYGSYPPSAYIKPLETANREYNGVAENKEAIFSDDNSRNYGRFVDNGKLVDKNEGPDYTGGRGQRSLSRNMQQQTLVETYGSVHERQRKLAMDRSAYRPLRTAPNPLTGVYHDTDAQIEDCDRDVIFRSRDRDPISSDPQEGRRPFSEKFARTHRRRLRSLSPSQLRRSKQFVRMASNRYHAASMYDIDRAMVNEEEYNNARNKHHFSSEATRGYHVSDASKEESRYKVGERAREPPKSASSSSSDISRDDRRDDVDRDAARPRDYSNDNSRSSTPHPAFDVITQQANHPSRDDVDSFFTPVDANKVECPIETTSAPMVDEAPKEWSSEDEARPTSRIGSISRHSQHGEPIAMDENCNRSTESSSGFPEQPEERSSSRARSIVSVIPSEEALLYENSKIAEESLQSTCDPRTASPKKSEPLYQSPGHSNRHSSLSNSPSKRNSRCSLRDSILERQTGKTRDSSEERLIASTIPDEDASVRSSDTVHSNVDNGAIDSPTIIIASRPHSHETVEYIENTRSVEGVNSRSRNTTQESTEEESSVNDTLEDRQSKDSASETNTEPGILKIEVDEPQSVEAIESRRRIPSKVPVRGVGRCRALSNKKIADKPSEKSKRMVQQCFAQLENKDWEVAMRGLKVLSQISKQYPECLDVCTVGTIGRLLGRHIRNLRSQVARAACLAASDIFSSQIRGIDQDLDEIAGPLLHRTADTNRFLRSDSNAALDLMVQHLPPHKTIGVIVLRGASHQNAIVRAATARLLSDITDRIGPDHIMILPRDVKDKLLNTGAKLLMDGNLDARNHAKRMFRRLTRCEGFRKAMTDAVPETTLRHIDKTMKTL